MNTLRMTLGGAAASAALLFSPVAIAADFCVVGAEVHTVAPAGSGQMPVCVADGRIVSVGDTPPPGVEIVDGTGATLTPGLVEVSSQVGLVEIWAVSASRNSDEGGEDEVHAAFRVIDAFDPDSTLIPIARSGGLTSVITTPSGGLISGQAMWFDMAGDDVEDMAVPEGTLMRMGLGNGAGRAVAGTRASALMRYREIFDEVSFWAQNQRLFTDRGPRDVSLSRLDMQALVPVLNGDVRVLFSASDRTDLRAGLRLAESFGIDIAFIGAQDAWAIADDLADVGVMVVVNPLDNLPFHFEALGSREDAAAILSAAGVPVVITSGETHNVRVLRQNAGNAVRAGMDWDAALAAITLAPAQLAGVDADYGSIEVGKVANLVLWSGDPLETMTLPLQMWIRGDEASLRTRQTALLERYRELPLR